ncbi:SH3 domain-containing protein Dlish [Culicoides brevitarsis]|uniref:SH3 domain-containing protein Dlish n=1 Tax=Culicoides brevitarsis TaxID=469753 RepID=UPI00307BCFC5
MAFLCPVRIRRGKKKKTVNTDNVNMGRITGSASIETLVRVGIEKEIGLSPDSKMVVLHDFSPCVDDELEVKRGQIVNILYRENDWVYVIGQESRQEGFIPHSYCAPYTELSNLAIKKKLSRDINSISSPDITEIEVIEENSLQHSQNSLSEPDFLMPFAKDPSGRYIVLYTFIARDENDVSVERGEFVTVLNREDPDWFWIVRSDGNEGFIPSGFVYPAEQILQGQQQQQQQQQGANKSMGNTNVATNQAQLNQTVGVGLTANNLPDVPQMDLAPTTHPQHGTELIMLYDFKSQASDDLGVRRGDWIYADLTTQTVEGWLWSYSPKTRKYGFIPKAYARPLNKALTNL